MASHNQIYSILDALSAARSNIFQLTIYSLSTPQLYPHPALACEPDDIYKLLRCLTSIPQFSAMVSTWAESLVHQTYTAELTMLTDRKNGLQFSSQHTTAEELEHLELQNMADKMANICPRLFILVSKLLTADSSLQKRREEYWESKEQDMTARQTSVDDSSTQDPVDEEVDEMVGGDVRMGPESDDDKRCGARRRREALVMIVSSREQERKNVTDRGPAKCCSP